MTMQVEGMRIERAGAGRQRAPKLIKITGGIDDVT